MKKRIRHTKNKFRVTDPFSIKNEHYCPGLVTAAPLPPGAPLPVGALLVGALLVIGAVLVPPLEPRLVPGAALMP